MPCKDSIKDMPLISHLGEKQNRFLFRAKRAFYKELSRKYQLYLLILLPTVFILLFHYVPMYGVIIAFKDFKASQGILTSPWVGLANFSEFFHSYTFSRIIRNTLELSIYGLLAGFPVPILLALSLNAIGNKPFKKIVQMATYAPFFISMVVMVGIITEFLSLRLGLINHIISFLGGSGIMFMAEPSLFSSIYVWSGIWQTMGWSSIIYLAALSTIDPYLHEAAVIDGASRAMRIINIDLPGIMPTIVILLILNMGNIMGIGFEKVFLLQNPLNLPRSEIIATYVYKVGLASGMPRYSYATAIGLFNATINFLLLLVVNMIAKRISEISIW